MSDNLKMPSAKSLFLTSAIAKEEQPCSADETPALQSSRLNAQTRAVQSRANQAKQLFLPHLGSVGFGQGLQARQENQSTHPAQADTATQEHLPQPSEVPVSLKADLLDSQPYDSQLETLSLSTPEPFEALAPTRNNAKTTPGNLLTSIDLPTYDSEQAKSKVKANPSAGHAMALTVLTGGNGHAIVGHGRRYQNSPRATVPLGTCLVLINEGKSLFDIASSLLESIDLVAFIQAKPAARERLIEQQLDNRGIVDSIIRKETLVTWEHLQVLDENTRFDDYQIEPPEDLTIFENSISVAKRTRLSDILEQNQGCYAVAASTETSDKPEPP